MSEQDINDQILSELQKVTNIIPKLHQAENAYKESTKLLADSAKKHSEFIETKDDLHTHVNNTRDNLQNLIKQLDQENTRKYEFLNKEIVKLKINYPKDLTPKLIELEKKIDELNMSYSSMLNEIFQIKQQLINKIYILIGLILVVTFVFISLYTLMITT